MEQTHTRVHSPRSNVYGPGERIRVLHLIKGLGRGGAELLLAETIRHSDRERFQYGYSYFLPWKNALVARLEQEDCPVHCFGGGNAASILMRAPKVASYAKQWGARLIHCHLPLAGIVGRAAGRMAGIPVVYTEHNKLERYHPLTRRLNVATWALQHQVIAVSSAVADSIVRFTRPSVPVHVLVNGVDTDRFDRDGLETGRDVRHELGIPDGALVVGTIAVFRKQKRLDQWIEAARGIHNALPQTVFVLVGGGPLEKEIREQVERSGLTGVVHFPGILEDVRPLLALMDVFMMSSMFEGLPVALLEAMAMRCPVVATSVGGIPEVVTHSVTGLLVEPNRPDQLGSAVCSLLESPERRAAIGRAAREVVEEKFGVRRMTRELESIYANILATWNAGATIPVERFSES